jgi:hypothetical protein
MERLNVYQIYFSFTVFVRHAQEYYKMKAVRRWNEVWLCVLDSSVALLLLPEQTYHIKKSQALITNGHRTGVQRPMG